MYCCYDGTSIIFKLISKGFTNFLLEQSVDGPLEKCRRILDEKVNFTSTNRGFCINNHAVATYAQIRKRIAQFYPKAIVEIDGIVTQPPNL